MAIKLCILSDKLINWAIKIFHYLSEVCWNLSVLVNLWLFFLTIVYIFLVNWTFYNFIVTLHILVMPLVLKSIWPDTDIVTPAFIGLIFLRYDFFHLYLFVCGGCALSYIDVPILKSIKLGFVFLPSYHLFLLTGEFR